MSDNLKITRPADATKVNIHEPYEVNYWCKELNVSKEKLIAAVKAAGVMVAAVKKHLGIK